MSFVKIAFDLGLNATNAILVLSLVAIGLAIIFGLMGVINLTHGSFMAIGAYTVWYLEVTFGLGFWVGLIVAPLFVAVIGLLTEFLVIRYLYDRLIDTLLATWGLAIVIRESIRFVFDERSKPVPNPLPGRVDLGWTTYPTYRLFMMALSVTVLLAVFYLFFRTRFGVRLRAVMQNKETAETLGLNQRRMNQFSYALGSGLAGLAGAVVAPTTSVQPDMGLNYLLQAFFAVIVGGTGSILMVIPGSAVVGGFTNVMTFFISPVVAQTLVFALIIGVLVLRARYGDKWGEIL
jgi:urea transport system permease protein